jgi:type II restriction enzyme
MANMEEARKILSTLGLPLAQQNEMSALTLLALCGLSPHDAWKKATRQGKTVTKGIMDFIAKEYGRQYAPNTRETFRRQALHQFVQGGIADYNPFAPDLPTNSPRAHYAITQAALAAMQTYGTRRWDSAVRCFLQQKGSLLTLYEKRHSGRLVPVKLSEGITLELSPGKHNQLQAAVIEQFTPRFAPGASLLYLGDTADKILHLDADRLAAAGIPVTEHEKLPDIILQDTRRKRLLLIEVVTSHGPMTPKRVIELQAMLSACTIPAVYLSAFPDFAEFRKHLKEIAWETEVWIAEIPDHMIHFNGDHFMDHS